MPAQSPSAATRPLADHAASPSGPRRSRPGAGPRAPRPRRRGGRAPGRRWPARPAETCASTPRPAAPRPAAAVVRRARPAPPSASWSSESASPGRATCQPALLEAAAGLGADHHLGPRRQAVLGVEGERLARTASANGRPGSPIAITELARALNPPEARSSQSPTDRVCTAGHDAFDMQARLLGRDPHPGRRPRRHRLAGDDVGQRDLGRGAVLAAHPRGRLAPRLHDAEQVGHRGAAGRVRSGRAAPGAPPPGRPRSGGRDPVAVGSDRSSQRGFRHAGRGSVRTLDRT